ncbi:hypothetical protein ACF0H5_015693 [Mactra antiquata]
MPFIVYTCNEENEQHNFYACLNNWRLIRDFQMVGYAGFLRNPALMDDICIEPDGYSGDKMDECVQYNVSPQCSGILNYWNGLKEFVEFLCLHREKFIRTGCRENLSFQGAYTMCMAKTSSPTSSKEESCRKYKDVNTCLHHAAKKYCSKVDRRFLIEAFDTRDSPTIAFACNFGTTTVTSREIMPLFLSDGGTNLAETTENGAKRCYCQIYVSLIMIICLLQRLI